MLSVTPTSHSPQQFKWPAPNLSLSSNSTSNGIFWALDSSTLAASCCQALLAYDATNLGNQLNLVYSPFGPVKFSVPTIANGKVYAGGNGGLAVFGPNTPATASVSPASLEFDTTPYCTDSNAATLKNTGAIYVSINRLAATRFSIDPSTTCNTVLGPGQSCQIVLDFQSKSCRIGQTNGSLQIFDSTGTSPQTVSLVGYVKGGESCGPPCP